MHPKLKLCSFIIFLHLPASCDTLANASQLKKNWQFEYFLHCGKAIKNYRRMPDNLSPAWLNELKIGIVANGDKYWHHLYNFPQVSVSFYHGSLGSEKVLGQNFAIIPGVTFNTWKNRPWQVHTSIGAGLAYFSKPFDQETNFDNRAIGSSVTAMATAGLYVDYNLARHMDFMLGASVIHCSNGHYQVPNYGLNLPSVMLGLRYRPNKVYCFVGQKPDYLPRGPLKYNIRAGLGAHEFAGTDIPTVEAKWAVYTADFYVSKRYGPVSNVHCGLAVKYYNGFYNKIKQDELYLKNQHLKAGVLTLFLAYELMIHKFSLVAQAGIDVYNPFYHHWFALTHSGKNISYFLESVTSTRVGVQYYLFDPKMNASNNVFIGTYVKANFGTADFVGINTGLVF
ncbi:MAG: hypothetical protein HC896_09210 [Bacteroidales bacterium]|nr:hypothetical protein [Bacteroidales bacterium]